MFSSVDAQGLRAVALASRDPEILNILGSALVRCRMDIASWPMHG